MDQGLKCKSAKFFISFLFDLHSFPTGIYYVIISVMYRTNLVILVVGVIQY